jgi:hypothetical protein
MSIEGVVAIYPYLVGWMSAALVGIMSPSNLRSMKIILVGEESSYYNSAHL